MDNHRRAREEKQLEKGVEDVAENLCKVQRNLEWLTMGVLIMRVKEAPQRLQCHMVGVPIHIVYLLRHVENAIVCYQETHVPWDD
jgi:hypothetical protein